MSLQAILSPPEDARSLAGSLALPGTAADCIACAFGKKGESAVAAYSDGRLVSWDLRDREEVCVTHNPLPQYALQLTSCSSAMLSCSYWSDTLAQKLRCIEIQPS